MHHVSRSPDSQLTEFVDALWYLSDAPTHARERILPSGTIELVINLHEDEFRIYDPDHTDRYRRFSGAIVSGAYRRFFVIDTLEHASIIGVHFKPAGAAPFLGIPPGELRDAHVDLDMLWGPHTAELREQLRTANDAAERFAILENALIARLSSAHRPHDAVRFAVERLESPEVTVGEIATGVQWSHRRLLRSFTAEVGVNPKLFGRLRRFQRARALAERGPSPDWARLAVDCGYFDQSHLIRDFVAFSGFTPTDLLRHRGVRVKEDHVALPGPEGASASTASV